MEEGVSFDRAGGAATSRRGRVHGSDRNSSGFGLGGSHRSRLFTRGEGNDGLTSLCPRKGSLRKNTVLRRRGDDRDPDGGRGCQVREVGSRDVVVEPSWLFLLRVHRGR